MPIEHVIFDCDGVLVDSETISLTADSRMLRSFGVSLPPDELHHRFVGVPSAIIWQDVSRQYGFALPGDFHDWYEDQMEAIYRAELKAVAGIREALAGLPVRSSCASNSTRRMLDLKLALTDLAGSFDGRLHSADDVAEAKPHPEIYLRAAALAGVAPARCLVIEDSPTGALAGIAAGMRVLGFTGAPAGSADPARALGEVGVHRVFSEMAQLPQLIEGLDLLEN